jgi:hypothetical protein
MPIAILKQGKGAGGLLSYLDSGKGGLQPDKASAWATGNLMGSRREDWALQMRVTAAESSRTEQPYLHLILSLDPKDPAQQLNDPQLIDLARDYLGRLNLADQQYVIALHRDTEHAHAHMVVNRVGDDGKAYPMWKFKERSWEVLRAIEVERGMRSPTAEQHIEITREALGQTERQGRPTWMVQVQTGIDVAVRNSRGDWQLFVHGLKQAGIEAKVSANGRGITFRLLQEDSPRGQPFTVKASSLGKRYRLTALRERIKLQPTLDREALRNRPGLSTPATPGEAPTLTGMIRTAMDNLKKLRAADAHREPGSKAMRDDPYEDVRLYNEVIDRYMAENKRRYAHLEGDRLKRRCAEADFRSSILKQAGLPSPLTREAQKLETMARLDRPYFGPEPGFSFQYEVLMWRTVGHSERLAQRLHRAQPAERPSGLVLTAAQRVAASASELLRGELPTSILPKGRWILRAGTAKQILASFRDTRSAAEMVKDFGASWARATVIKRAIAVSGPLAPAIVATLSVCQLVNAFADYMKTEEERRRDQERERELGR